jgi:hypothetical protein
MAGDADNPLIHPDANPPGVRTPTGPTGNDLHPNAVAQEYNTAGGKRAKGAAKPTNYQPAKPPSGGA